MKKLSIPRLEIEIDLDKLQNPKLKRIINEREKQFLFNYGDRGPDDEEYNQHRDYKVYSDYKEEYSCYHDG